MPSTATHCSASHAAVPDSDESAASVSVSGQGSDALSTLPEVRTGRSSTTARSGISGAGSVCASSARAALAIEALGGHDVADQEGHAAFGTLHDDGRGGDGAEGLQGGLDLAELDAPAADLDLIVGAALEEQPGAARAARGRRSGRRGPSRGWASGAYFSASFAGSRYRARPTPPMMSSPTSPSATGSPGRVDDREGPAIEGKPDPDGTLPVQQRRARDHGRLGGAVGVPHLPTFGDQARDQLGRARLAAEDQQAHVLDRVLRPQRGERRHRRDDGDAVADQPGPEILAGSAPALAARERDTRRAARPATSLRRTRRTPPTARRAHGRPARAARSAGRAGPPRRRRRRRTGGMTATPLGTPVDPDVKMIQASSSTLGGGTVVDRARARVRRIADEEVVRRVRTPPARSVAGTRPFAVITPLTPASPKTRSARSGGSSASTGT